MFISQSHVYHKYIWNQMRVMYRALADRVSHMGLEAEPRRGAEGGRIEAQQTLSVAGRVQALNGPLQHLQASPPGGLQAQLC